MMNSQLINGLHIDWSKIDKDSYLHRIDELKGIDMTAYKLIYKIFREYQETGEIPEKISCYY